MVDRRKTMSLISSQDHCQRSSPSRISNTLRAEFEPAQNLSSGLVERSSAVVITTTPLCQLCPCSMEKLEKGSFKNLARKAGKEHSCCYQKLKKLHFLKIWNWNIFSFNCKSNPAICFVFFNSIYLFLFFEYKNQ